MKSEHGHVDVFFYGFFCGYVNAKMYIRYQEYKYIFKEFTTKKSGSTIPFGTSRSPFRVIITVNNFMTSHIN